MALDIHLEPPRQHAEPSTNLPARQNSKALECQTPANHASASVDIGQHTREGYGDGDGPRAAPGAVDLAEPRFSSTFSSRRKLKAAEVVHGSYQQQQQQCSFPPTFHGAATSSTYDGRPPVDGYVSDMHGDISTSAQRATCSTARRPARTKRSTGGEPNHGGSSGEYGGGINPAVEKGARSTAGEDFAVVGDPASAPSPIEQALARRKRRRRANFSVSSALLLSASAEDMFLPPVPARRPFSSLPVGENDKRDSAAGLGDNLESLELR